MRKLPNLFLCFFLNLFNCELIHECIHDQITKDFFIPALPKTNLNDNNNKRKLSNKPWEPIRIYFDTTYLFSMPADLNTILTKKILPYAKEFIQKRVLIPAMYHVAGVFADLLLFVTFSKESSSTLAWATACFLDHTNYYRPVVGQINFNINKMSTKLSDFAYQIDITLHEIMHVLGFSPGLFKNWVDSNGVPLGVANIVGTIMLRSANRTILKTQKLTNTARNHYNCPTIQGVELENQGKSGTMGSHFEKTLLYNELMTGTIYRGGAEFSYFTLSLLEDTGWYQIDYNYAEPFTYGKNRGCNFINYTCSMNFFEFCYTKNEFICSFNYFTKGSCLETALNDNCMMRELSSNGDCRNNQLIMPNATEFGEILGGQSKCVVSSFVKTNSNKISSMNLRCFKYNCIANNTQIEFLIGGNNSLLCDNLTIGANKTLQGWSGYLTCPNPVDFCDLGHINCTNYCSGFGFCVNGNCECKPGHYGVDCSLGFSYGLRFSIMIIFFIVLNFIILNI